MKACNFYKIKGILVLFCAAMAISSSAQTLTTLVSFDGTNGSSPAASLIQASDGNLYGTTEYGGTFSGCEGGFNPCGTVFKVTLSGTLTTLHTFDYGDGAFPVSPVVQGTDGNFYGTNQGEGDSGGAGAIFKMTPSGTVTVLSPTSSPAGLVEGRDGNFYGTTPQSYTYGTVFKITPSGTLTTLHTFDGTDGGNPQAGLTLATDGNFYGTTYSGGTSNYCGGGCGTVFKMTPSGSLTTLHSFSGTDGYNVYAGLVEGTDGNFYGTTFNGGAQNAGEVYKITPSGTLTVLHSFCSQTNCTDGAYPRAALIQATDGNFYGTTFQGGANNSQGTVFSITPGGSLTTLYSFCAQTGCADGADPIGGVIQATDGNFYGTTFQGGATNQGAVFKLSVSYSTLTVSVNGNGAVTSTDGFINCPGTCSHSYLQNTQVTLNATPATGWAFSGWAGACSGTGSCQITMTQNINVSATFYQLPVTLTVSVAGDGSVASTDGYINCPGTCQHTYNPGAPVTLNATAASGWLFSGWTGACSGVGTCNITMTQNLAVTAVFVEPGHGIQFITVVPCRVVDTRNPNGPFGGPAIQGGTSRSFAIPQGACNIPSNAAAYSLNVTVVPHGPLGFLSIWPTGEAQPYVSTMNSLRRPHQGQRRHRPRRDLGRGQRVCLQYHRRCSRHRRLLCTRDFRELAVLSPDTLPRGRYPRLEQATRVRTAVPAGGHAARVAHPVEPLLSGTAESAAGILVQRDGDPVIRLVSRCIFWRFGRMARCPWFLRSTIRRRPLWRTRPSFQRIQPMAISTSMAPTAPMWSWTSTATSRRRDRADYRYIRRRLAASMTAVTTAGSLSGASVRCPSRLARVLRPATHRPMSSMPRWCPAVVWDF